MDPRYADPGKTFPLKRIDHFSGHALYTPALNQHSVVVDIGANNGRFSDELRSAYQCSSIMVEPNPDLARLLTVRGARVFEVAIGGADGAATFNVSSNSEASSMLRLPDTSVYGATLDKTIAVQAMSLATFLEQLGYDRIDVLKMDIEGAETAALDSVSDESLRRVAQISVEFHDDPSFQFDLHRHVTSTIRRLKQAGFAYLQFNRPARTNSLFLGPALGLSPFEVAWLRTRYDYWRAFRLLPLRWPTRQ